MSLGIFSGDELWSRLLGVSLPRSLLPSAGGTPGGPEGTVVPSPPPGAVTGVISNDWYDYTTKIRVKSLL